MGVNDHKMKKEVALIIFLILGLSSSSERLSKRIGYYAGFSLSDKIRGHYVEKEKALESKARLRELKLRGILASKLLINSILEGFGPPKDYLDGDGMGKRVEADPLCSLRNRNMNRNVNRNIPIKLFSLYN